MHRKTTLAAALTLAMGSATSVHSATVDYSFSGWMTVLSPDGSQALQNTDTLSSAMYGWRTPISGTLSFDEATGAGTGSIVPFSFFGYGLFETRNLTLQAIGDGAGNAGDLILGNMTNDWNSNIGIPRSIVWDATGLFNALASGFTTADTVTGGALAATDDFVFANGKFTSSTYTLPIGPGPLVTTTWNTAPIGTPQLGTNPSGTLPLTDDGIGGSPDVAGPTVGFNYNFDIVSLQPVSVAAVPLPSAIWLFGTGLAALTSVVRRRKR